MARKGRKRRSSDSEAGAVALLIVLIFAKLQHWLTIPWVIVCVPIAVAVLFLAFSLLYRKRKFDKATMNEIDRMTGEEFELTLQYHLKKTGWKVATTEKTRDFGADLVGTDPQGVRCVIQAKRWNERVGIKGVQEVVGARSYYQAQRALVITNNYLTKSAWELAERADVEIWNRKRLEKLLAATLKDKERHNDN